MNVKRLNILLCLIGIGTILSGCASKTVEVGASPYSQASAIKSQGGMYKVGNPYKIFGTWYYPKEDYSYSEVGTASWYGKDFHARKTANGEKYDMNTLTAAHRTLPLPSIVKVTNLENGRSLILRVNDRGPYAKNRIIDISKRGAQLLGFQVQGTAKVRVEVMEKESKALKAALTGQPCDTSVATVIPQKTLTYAPASTSYVKQNYSDAESAYYVQAGAFSSRASANNLSTKLSNYGKTKVAQAVVDGKTFYRVRLGPFPYKEEAEVSLARIKSYGIYNAKVVRD